MTKYQVLIKKYTILSGKSLIIWKGWNFSNG